MHVNQRSKGQCHEIFDLSYQKNSTCAPYEIFRVNVDYADTRFSNFKIEYLHENEKALKTGLTCLYVAHEESFEQNNRGGIKKSRDTVPPDPTLFLLMPIRIRIFLQ